jgi:CheY-like chemotaxis protein
LVLMDMQMPVMDGLTAVREIRRLEAVHGSPRLPIVMLTANAMPEHVADAKAAGADLHLGKPFTAQSLFDAIGEALVAVQTEAEELAA